MNPAAVDPMTSRRSLLGGGALVAIGALALGIAGAAAAAAAKSSQKAVEYQGHPKAGHSCNTCKNFQPPAGCKVVEGPVESSGWCDKYTHS
jgi:hypothetical protein